jgi:hypothetical protein
MLFTKDVVNLLGLTAGNVHTGGPRVRDTNFTADVTNGVATAEIALATQGYTLASHAVFLGHTNYRIVYRTRNTLIRLFTFEITSFPVA